MEHFVYRNQKKLRLGYTTGACAAAAAKAAARMLLGGEKIRQTTLMTPRGILFTAAIEQIKIMRDMVSCAVRKDAGDDHDVTDGVSIYACVTRTDSGFTVDGGEGVGRVTRPGLDQPVGSAAINSVPRQMIIEEMRQAADDYGYEGGLKAVISVPDGAGIARRTMNADLGIEGGISILGTSGIVEPMSEAALVDTIRAQISMYCAQGLKDLIVTPGNYGETFLSRELGMDLDHTVKCSNFIGDTIDMAYEFGLDSILLVGHLGKLVKLGSGIMNTHSRYADGRMETLASCVLLAGRDASLARRMLTCNTTDEAVDVLMTSGCLKEVMAQLAMRIDCALRRRACEGLYIEAVFFSNQYGVLGMTDGAERLMELHRRQRM